MRRRIEGLNLLALLFLFLWAALMWPVAYPVTGEILSLEECALRSGYSTEIFSPHLAPVTGENAWAEMGEKVLLEGDQHGTLWYDTDTGVRPIWVYFYKGVEYWFIPKHHKDPGAGFDEGAWHGDCFIQR